MTEKKYEYTNDMHELSGFGGSYEEACRRMAVVGATWLDEHPGELKRWREMDGQCRSDPQYAAFEQAVGNVEPDCTGAMHGAAVSHAFAIHKMGWDAYAAEMRRLRAEEQEPS